MSQYFNLMKIWLILFTVLPAKAYKILCMANGYMGHVRPILELCVGLSKSLADTEVRFSSHEVFKNRSLDHVGNLITSKGMEFIPLGEPGPWRDTSDLIQDFSYNCPKDSTRCLLNTMKQGLGKHFIPFWEEHYLNTMKLIESYQPDVVVIEGFLFGALDAIRHMNIPYVQIQTFPLLILDPIFPPIYSLPPAVTGSNIMKITSTSTLYERLQHIFLKLAIPLYMLSIHAELFKLRWSFGYTPASFVSLPTDARAVIVHSSWVHEVPRLLPPNIHLIGSLLNTTEVQLSLRDQSDSHGSKYMSTLYGESHYCASDESTIIYMALGSLSALSGESLVAVKQGFLHILNNHTDSDTSPYCIIWSLKTLQEGLLNITLATMYPNQEISTYTHSHLKIVNWAPQMDLLSMNRLLLFISHCGMGSIAEGLSTNTRMICLPVFADQFDNAKRLKERRISLDILSNNGFTAMEFANTVSRAVTEACLYDPRTLHSSSSSSSSSSTHSSQQQQHQQQSVSLLQSPILLGEAIRSEGGLDKAISIVTGILHYGSVLDHRLTLNEPPVLYYDSSVWICTLIVLVIAIIVTKKLFSSSTSSPSSTKTKL